MTKDDAQEAVLPVHGFLQATYLKIHKWVMSLPSPWNVRSMRDQLGGNKEFGEAAIAARSKSSECVKVLVEGKP